jgi:cytochrome c peroxidase
MKRPRVETGVGGTLCLAGICVAIVSLAHDGEKHPEPQALAPGHGELAFVLPTPGSYALPPLGDAADGAVLSADGDTSTLHEQFGDGLVLLSFIYASCNDVNGCPLATAVLHRVAKRTSEDPVLAGRLRLVSLSFDPARDTPEVMRRYGAQFARGGVDWTFLTTNSPAQLSPILDAYGQGLVTASALGGSAGDIAHVLRVFLIDSSQKIRNVYTVSFLHADTLVSDALTLLLESEPGAVSGGSAGGVPEAALRAGDDREGYEDRDYASRSLSLAARRGVPTDLAGRVASPPLGLPPVSEPEDNPVTAEKVELGRKLFYDLRLSLNDTVSCAMCHIPEQGFTSNELSTAVGIEGRTVRRNSPTIYNVAYLDRLFHDGRETRLEHQVWGPLLARNEMANPSIGAVLEKVRGLDDYDARFEAAFPGRGLAMETLGRALASYQRTLVSGDSPFDRWHYGGDETALGADARRGFEIFVGKGSCSGCHTLGAEYALFTDNGFHNTGIGFARAMLPEPAKTEVQVGPGLTLSVDTSLLAPISETPPSDLGRYEVTEDPADRWRYRTPTLRNVALSAPYMHDGSLRTLRDVVVFYAKGGAPNPVLDPRIRPLDLSESEIDDLVAFLEALTGSDVDTLVADAFAAPVGDRQ